MLMLTKTHDRNVVELNNFIAEQALLIAKLTGERDAIKAGNLKLASKLRISEHRYDVIEARLAVFTAPRDRDAKGHFISAKGASA